jgi:hypothetical protein
MRFSQLAQIVAILQEELKHAKDMRNVGSAQKCSGNLGRR